MAYHQLPEPVPGWELCPAQALSLQSVVLRLHLQSVGAVPCESGRNFTSPLSGLLVKGSEAA